MDYRFVLRTRRPRPWYWIPNDHMAALLEHAPAGPWADVPPPLAAAIQTIAAQQFGRARFTMPQIVRRTLCHELMPPPDETADPFLKDVYRLRVATYGPPIARDYQHVGRLIADALRQGGWRVFVTRGIVIFQKTDDPRIPTPVPPTREPASVSPGPDARP